MLFEFFRKVKSFTKNYLGNFSFNCFKFFLEKFFFSFQSTNFFSSCYVINLFDFVTILKNQSINTVNLLRYFFSYLCIIYIYFLYFLLSITSKTRGFAHVIFEIFQDASFFSQDLG